MDVPLTPEEQEKFERAKPSWMKEGLFPSMPERIIGSPSSSISRSNINRRLSPMQDAPEQDPIYPLPACGLSSVAIIFNAVEGADFGYGMARPVQMTKADFLAALDWHDASFSNCPLAVHALSLDVTPPCSPTGELSSITPDVVVNRVDGTCYRSSSDSTISLSDNEEITDNVNCPGACDASCNKRFASWGASGDFLEILDFGDVAVEEADWDSATTVWVSYSASATGEWACALSYCYSGPPGSPPCLDSDGNICVTGTGSSGVVCSNIISIGDPSAPPAGTVSQVDIVFGDGSTWTTTASTLSLFICDIASFCPGTPGFTVTY